MHIERPHTLGQAAAIEKIDGFVDGLLKRQLPAGVTVTNPQKSWQGNTMNFSFRASKGFFGATIAGFVLVTDTAAAIDVEVPPMIRALVSEDQIRQVASEQFDQVLQA